jgi:hypothetical protein
MSVSIVIALLAAAVVSAECPDVETMRARLAEVDLTRAARTQRFEQPVPAELHGEAIAAVSKPFAVRDGGRVTGVMVAPVAAAAIWRAINDEEHHAEGFLPVNYSEVVEGRPRGKDRVLFQYYARAGIGRWWASRVFINDKVHEATGGKVWELHWSDWMDEVDRTLPTIAKVNADIRPIVASEGAWLLVPLGESCTLIEEYSSSDPGGALGAIQALVAAGAIRDTLTGIVEMATDHRCEPPAASGFHGPDGKLLKTPALDSPANPSSRLGLAHERVPLQFR